MISYRKAESRGVTDWKWLKSYHSFSFGDYFDPLHMGFSVLRVINDDIVAPSHGFDTHGHRDMEIITYVLNGALNHRDSMGNGSTISSGDVQRMSAGRGVLHSEHNLSPNLPCHLLQIWITPKERGGEPSYEQKSFTKKEKLNRLKLIASEHGEEESIRVQQDVKIYASILDIGESIQISLNPHRSYWLHVAKGTLIQSFNEELKSGDAMALTEEHNIMVRSHCADTEFLLFDLPSP